MEDVFIRPYMPGDKSRVMALLRLNTPRYFAPAEETDLAEYLEGKRELYYVLETADAIVGCGGINFPDDATACISWDILDPAYQGRSLGTRLMRHRLSVLQSMPLTQRIIVRTSQLAYLFYEKQGFRLTQVTRDYWAEGYDLYHMEYGMPVHAS